ncbi:hypothetical protein SAMN04488539_1868 [Corynebacterium timonense]|uniref:Uncharacterized protein n=1 Tax=Corynebacterium timonense TaxID=441500 RepID=A0A1H1T0B0_9CORY|nr:hypothetical protein SAMN04488539_1868 [Corynebacterium timonense]
MFVSLSTPLPEASPIRPHRSQPPREVHLTHDPPKHSHQARHRLHPGPRPQKSTRSRGRRRTRRARSALPSAQPHPRPQHLQTHERRRTRRSSPRRSSTLRLVRTGTAILHKRARVTWLRRITRKLARQRPRAPRRSPGVPTGALRAHQRLPHSTHQHGACNARSRNRRRHLRRRQPRRRSTPPSRSHRIHATHRRQPRRHRRLRARRRNLHNIPHPRPYRTRPAGTSSHHRTRAHPRTLRRAIPVSNGWLRCTPCRAPWYACCTDTAPSYC